MCGNLHSRELKCLAESIPHRVMEAKAKSTIAKYKYSSAFYDFKACASKYYEIVFFPAKPFSVALYIEYLMQKQCSYSRIEATYYRIHCSLGPVYEFVCISFRTDNLNCFRAS
jgi:hypothetical protein